jgi:hypothetical protein
MIPVHGIRLLSLLDFLLSSAAYLSTQPGWGGIRSFASSRQAFTTTSTADHCYLKGCSDFDIFENQNGSCILGLGLESSDQDTKYGSKK